MQTSLDVQTSIVKKIKEISQSSSGIAAAVEEQSATANEISNGLQQINRTVSHLSDSVKSVATGAQTTEQAADDVQKESKVLSVACNELRTGIDGFIKTLTQ